MPLYTTDIYKNTILWFPITGIVNHFPAFISTSFPVPSFFHTPPPPFHQKDTFQEFHCWTLASMLERLSADLLPRATQPGLPGTSPYLGQTTCWITAITHLCKQIKNQAITNGTSLPGLPPPVFYLAQDACQCLFIFIIPSLFYLAQDAWQCISIFIIPFLIYLKIYRPEAHVWWYSLELIKSTGDMMK